MANDTKERILAAAMEWGQRVVRFYDPDGHIIEVGEKLDAVISRFMEQGLSTEETAARMDIPVDFVTAYLNRE